MIVLHDDAEREYAYGLGQISGDRECMHWVSPWGSTEGSDNESNESGRVVDEMGWPIPFVGQAAKHTGLGRADPNQYTNNPDVAIRPGSTALICQWPSAACVFTATSQSRCSMQCSEVRAGEQLLFLTV
jgi:hypothetical protein